MISFIMDDKTALEKGLKNPLGNFLSWDYILQKGFIFKFKEDYVGWKDVEHPFTFKFYWVDIIPTKNDTIYPFRIHFPKGEEQRNEFKDLVAFYLLKEKNLLDTLTDNSEKVNDFLYNIFYDKERK